MHIMLIKGYYIILIKILTACKIQRWEGVYDINTLFCIIPAEIIVMIVCYVKIPKQNMVQRMSCIDNLNDISKLW